MMYRFNNSKLQPLAPRRAIIKNESANTLHQDFTNSRIDTDSFTSCQYSLLCGGEDDRIGTPQLWLDYYRYLGRGISMRAEDDSEEDFWKEYECARPWRPADAEDDEE